MHNVTNLFMEIVKIDSVTGEEEQMSQYVMEYLSKNCHLQPIRDKYNNVFVQTQGSGKPIFFNSHLDTVEPGRGIIPELHNGVITSKGNTVLGADDKAAVAATLTALEFICNNPEQSWRPLDILFTTSEEIGNYGAIGFDKSKIRAKTGFIFDGSGPVGNIMSASPYYARFDITITGVPAHAGYPDKATPAVPVMLTLIQAIEELRTQDVLINIGEIAGGTARNTIIGSITLHGEIRSFYSSNFTTAITALKKICNKKYTCKINSEVVVENPGYIFSDQDIAPIKKQIEMVLKKQIEVKQSFGVSDANIFNENPKKLQVFNLGDGSSDAHTTDESTTVAALETMQELILNLAKNQE